MTSSASFIKLAVLSSSSALSRLESQANKFVKTLFIHNSEAQSPGSQYKMVVQQQNNKKYTAVLFNNYYSTNGHWI